ncbi:hypothetical protein BAE44_0016399 [Dichanthelium oligosanthes]|uniref:At1g61320/AtMIF1 LRR domain-containing protein n=1 Tax=Dichanthelium oligosanthes TaxID=888268 RepID=A0A1E5VBQ6_9POAL|nr:hypothetical protein BAE44_0016399 [Dichanthelium oligosanthes]
MVVDRFELRSPVLEKEHAHHLDKWFGFVAATKARHVTLDFSPVLHSNHCIAASPKDFRLLANQVNGWSSSCCTDGIVSLFLSYVCLELPPVTDGSLLRSKTLKKLELKCVVNLGDATPFIANCPALEWLSISNSWIRHLVVPQASCLHYLRLKSAGLQSIHLNATSLTTFEYEGSPSVPIKTNNALKLSQASILLNWLNDTVDDFWDELSGCLAPVDRLVLRFRMCRKTRLINNPIKFIHLRHLTLFCDILGDPESALGVLRLTQILESAPQLEHFVLHMDSYDSRSLFLKTADSIHPHVHHHLKTVQMTGVLGLSGQLELAKYILLSADALEFMALNLARIRTQHVKLDYPYFTMLEKFAKNYLDPQGVYSDVLKIVGPSLTCH